MTPFFQYIRLRLTANVVSTVIVLTSLCISFVPYTGFRSWPVSNPQVRAIDFKNIGFRPGNDDTVAIPLTAPTTGTLNLAALYVSFNDMPALSLAEVNKLLFSPSTFSLSTYIASASYGRARLSGRTIGPLHLSASCDASQIERAAVDRATEDNDLSSYEHVIVITPASCGSPLVSASVRAQNIRARTGKTIRTTLAIIQVSKRNASLFVAHAVHEFGHGLGLGHAGSLRRFPIDDRDLESAGYDEYGDVFSAMGIAKLLSRDSVPIGHYNAPHKARLGWLARDEVRFLTPNDFAWIGSYTDKYAVYRAAVLPIGQNWLWFEHRQPDDPFERSLQFLSESIFEGALMHVETALPDSGRTYLLTSVRGPDDVLLGGQSWSHSPYRTRVEITTAKRGIGIRVKTANGQNWFVKGM